MPLHTRRPPAKLAIYLKAVYFKIYFIQHSRYIFQPDLLLPYTSISLVVRPVSVFGVWHTTRYNTRGKNKVHIQSYLQAWNILLLWWWQKHHTLHSLQFFFSLGILHLWLSSHPHLYPQTGWINLLYLFPYCFIYISFLKGEISL